VNAYGTAISLIYRQIHHKRGEECGKISSERSSQQELRMILLEKLINYVKH